MFQLFEYRDDTEASSALAEAVSRALQDSIDRRGAALMAVSGGRSPAAFFRSLRTHDVAWKAVTITLADERQVEAGSPLSNAGLVEAELLQGPAAHAGFRSLASFAGQAVPTFDVMVLGMGLDGHVASLFANAPRGRDDAPALLSILPDPLPSEAPVPRLSWNLPAILSAERVFLQAYGPAKRAVLDAAASAIPPDSALAALLQNARNNLQVFATST